LLLFLLDLPEVSSQFLLLLPAACCCFFTALEWDSAGPSLTGLVNVHHRGLPP